LIDYYHRIHLDIPDAFIAAALVTDSKIATLNEKHFKSVKNLSLEIPY